MAIMATLLSSLQTIISLAATAFGIGFIIAFHELGHFLFARLFGIAVPTFSIGFGPVMYAKQWGQTNFVLSAIPFGGYVDLSPVSPDDTNTLMAKPWYQKMLVMIGGIWFNFMFAFMTFLAVFLWGAPKTGILFPLNATTTIGNVIAESPAEKAGLRVDDTIIAINGLPVVDAMPTLVECCNQAENKNVEITVQHPLPSGELETRNVTLAVGSKNIAGRTIDSLGMSFKLLDTPSQSLLAAFGKSMQLTWFHLKSIFNSYVNLFRKTDFSNLGGPIMIIKETMNASYKGIAVFFLVLALISLNLGVLNLIPLPILDGGQMLLYSIQALFETVFKRPLSETFLDAIRLGSWILAIVISILLSAHDIIRIASPYIERITAFVGL